MNLRYKKQFLKEIGGSNTLLEILKYNEKDVLEQYKNNVKELRTHMEHINKQIKIAEDFVDNDFDSALLAFKSPRIGETISLDIPYRFKFNYLLISESAIMFANPNISDAIINKYKDLAIVQAQIKENPRLVADLPLRHSGMVNVYENKDVSLNDLLFLLKNYNFYSKGELNPNITYEFIQHIYANYSSGVNWARLCLNIHLTEENLMLAYDIACKKDGYRSFDGFGEEIKKNNWEALVNACSNPIVGMKFIVKYSKDIERYAQARINLLKNPFAWHDTICEKLIMEAREKNKTRIRNCIKNYMMAPFVEYVMEYVDYV